MSAPPPHDHGDTQSADHGGTHRHDHGDTHRHDRGCEHDHGHGGLSGLLHHHHDVRDLAATPKNRRALRWALAIALVFLIVEVVGGITYNSLALLSDAAHMLTDVAAYALALFAVRMAQRPPTARRTYGYARAEILAALVNGATLIAASGWILVEATRRMLHPVEVGGTGVVIVAAVGLLANIAIVLALLNADRGNLNIRGALLHGITDALSSVAVLLAGAAIAVFGFTRADSIASMLITLLVLWGSWRLVRESVDVLLDATPTSIDADAVAAAMVACAGVTEVHDLHVWTLGPGTPALSAHVRTDAVVRPDELIAALTGLLHDSFGISHATLQLAVDRSTIPLDAVERLPLHDAVEWATDHIARTHPTLARSVIMAATGAAAINCRPDEKVSPIAISVRALSMLGRGNSSDTP